MKQSNVRYRGVLVFLALIVVTAIGMKVFSWSRAEETIKDSEESNLIDVLQKQVNQMKSRMAANERKSSYIGMKVNELRTQEDELEKQEERTDEDVEPNSSKELMTPEEMDAHADALAQRQISLLEETLDDEPRDGTWSDNAADLLLQAYTGDSYKELGLDIDVECKSTICQVDFSINNENNRESGMKMLVVDAPWKSQGFTQYNMETGVGTFYLAREGHELPKAPEESTTTSL